ncbi:MAG: dehydrogenase [Bacteroidetes bacterium]|nr:dehydrogenase [Bacteroidota bacterium]
MIIRSKAPLRISLGGGGTDLEAYSTLYGGAILNATISLYAYASIQPRDDKKISIYSIDRDEQYSAKSVMEIQTDHNGLILHKGIYNRIVREFAKHPLSFDLTTYVDAPPGSGLGSSSTLVVAILGAFTEWLRLPLGEYDIARLAYEIERIDLRMPGGKQDQYAATFGGVNFMEFFKDKVIVNPLRISPVYLNELSFTIVLYNTEVSRLSTRIIEDQTRNVRQHNMQSVEAMHRIKEQAIMMKEALLKGDFDKIGEILDFGWQNKKLMAEGITNPYLDEIYDTAMKSGATGGKISGAGGGGFMFFYCPNNTRTNVIKALRKFGGDVKRYDYTSTGLETWTI